MKLDTCNIFYESWQIQCCGKPFKIGDRVRWSCVYTNDEKIICGYKIDFNEEHHGDETHAIIGTITDIKAVTQTDSQDEKCHDFDAEKLSLANLVAADGYESEKKATDDNYFIFWGYIVTMNDVEVSSYDDTQVYDYD